MGHCAPRWFCKPDAYCNSILKLLQQDPNLHIGSWFGLVALIGAQGGQTLLDLLDVQLAQVDAYQVCVFLLCPLLKCPIMFCFPVLAMS